MKVTKGMKKRTIISILLTVLFIMITNDFWLVRNNQHAIFQFDIFLIILILSFALFYKLTNYVADYKSIKEQSRLDIIFLVIFFVFLFVPMLHFDKSEISERENRTLAKWKPLINNGTINYNFGNDFNEWFNDRFYQRKFLINIYKKLTLNCQNHNNKGIIDENTGFLYINTEFRRWTPVELSENFKALYEFNDWCKIHKINLYVLITPPKTEIYPPNNSYIIIRDKDHKYFLNYINKINKEGNLKIIYPYDEMLINKNKNYMFHKTSHHWTHDGAFIGYKELIKQIKKDFKDVNILNEKDFNYSYNELVQDDFDKQYKFGTTTSDIGITDPKKYHQTKYRYYNKKDYDKLHQQIIDEELHREKLFHYAQGANYRVILLGTSQSENLTEFIPYTFKDVKRLRNNAVKGIPDKESFKIMKYYEKEMLEYRPDIIIFCIDYNNIIGLYNLFNKE